jgi:hypothetical protein
MRHITSCSGQARRLLSDDGPAAPTRPRSKKRTRREPNGRARAPAPTAHKCLTHSLTQFTPLAAGCYSRPLMRNLRSHGATPRVTGPRRTADGVPDGHIASPLPVWASHDRLFIAIGARGMPHRDLTRRLLPLPIIHATSPVSSISSVSHNPCQTRFQWPRAAPAPCARTTLQSPQADAARGADPPTRERLRVRSASRSVSSARLHARFRQFTLGFVSSSTRTSDSGLTHAPQP